MATHNILHKLQVYAQDLNYEPGNTFSWSAKTQTVTFKPDTLREPAGIWALIHETAHGLLQHKTYSSDFELLQLEVAAWERAKELATQLGVAINEDHIQDCLDTYRDWLHRRSTCPTCGTASLQTNKSTYQCHNCLTTWRVSPARFCRPYRKRITTHS